MPELSDVRVALEFEAYLAQAAEPEVEFRVEIERPGCLDGESLDLAVGQRSEVALLPRQPCTLTAIKRLSVNTTKSRTALKHETICSPGITRGATAGAMSSVLQGLSLKTEPLEKSITGPW